LGYQSKHLVGISLNSFLGSLSCLGWFGNGYEWF